MFQRGIRSRPDDKQRFVYRCRGSRSQVRKPEPPWYVRDQYLDENRGKLRGVQGPGGRRANPDPN